MHGQTSNQVADCQRRRMAILWWTLLASLQLLLAIAVEGPPSRIDGAHIVTVATEVAFTVGHPPNCSGEQSVHVCPAGCLACHSPHLGLAALPAHSALMRKAAAFPDRETERPCRAGLAPPGPDLPSIDRPPKQAA